MLIIVPGRLFSHYFSVLQAIKALFNGLLRLLDIFIGVPSLLAHNLEAKIREERSRYLVAELVCRVIYHKVIHMIVLIVNNIGN